jgi:hypothetical protein
MPTPAIAGVELRPVKRFDSVMPSWQMTWQPTPHVNVMARVSLGVQSVFCQLKFQKIIKSLEFHNSFISNQKNANNIPK